jgi:HlyD family secretion protein
MKPVEAPRTGPLRRRALRLSVSGALAVIVVLLFAYFRAGVPVEVVLVARGPVVSSITSTATGTVQSERDVHVMSQVPGQIAEILVDEGDPVHVGDLLAQLDAREAEASRRLAEANLQNARSNLERAQVSERLRGDTADTEVTRASAVLEKAHSDRARARELFAAGILSRAALEAAEIDERVADSSYRAAAARATDREVARSEVKAARALVSQTRAAAEAARVVLERTRITAPFDGVVAARYVQPGQTIVPSTPLFSIVDRADIRVRATFDEVDVARIQTGQTVRLLLDSFPGRRFEGLVEEISPTVSTSRQENRTVTLKIRFARDVAGVRPGMSADAEIIVGSRNDALFLPTDVIIEAGAATGSRRVWVVSAGRADLREVSTGLSNWDFTEIVSGLAQGDKVISSLDAVGLTPGARVKARPASMARTSR